MYRYILKRLRNTGKTNEGFTLLEILMAVSILTVGLLAVASLQVTAMRGNSMSMDYTESTERVQDTIEKLLNRPFTHDDLNDTNSDGTGGLDDDTEATADHSVLGSGSNAEYDIFWNIADDQVWNGAAWREVNGVKTIRIIVKWQVKGAGKDYSFDLLRNRI